MLWCDPKKQKKKKRKKVNKETGQCKSDLYIHFQIRANQVIQGKELLHKENGTHSDEGL